MNTAQLGNLKRWQLDAGGLILCFALSAGAYFGMLAPVLRDRAAAGERREALDERSQQAVAVRNELRRVSHELDEAQRTLAEFELRLEPATRINQRLADLTTAAGTCGLSVSDIRPQKPIATARHTVVPIELSGVGTFPDCLRFMHRLRQNFGDSGLATFELASAPSASSASSAEVSFHFKVHWFVEPTATASAQ